MNSTLILDLISSCFVAGDSRVKTHILSTLPFFRKRAIIYKQNVARIARIVVEQNGTNYFVVSFLDVAENTYASFYVKGQNDQKRTIFAI